MKKIEKDNVVIYSIEESEVNEISKEQYVELYKQQIEEQATTLVKTTLRKLDYDSEGEVALYAANPDSEWHDEAVKLQAWIEGVYKKMYELQDSVTTQNYKEIDLDKLEAEYPAFEE
jgi:hypothetical protein